MIPKKIHYCWFGGKQLPPLAKKCIASWKKYCPDWEIIRWDESNFDVNALDYTRYCYENENWAFLSDFVRLQVVQAHGGVYLDTDVELVKPLDALIMHEAFFGFENSQIVNTGLGFGAEAGHETVRAMLLEYLALAPGEQGDYPLVACPHLNTAALQKLGLVKNGQRQTVAGAQILPVEYLNPYEDATGRLEKTGNTVSIHWYNKSWVSPAARLRSRLTKPLHRLFGEDCFDWLKGKKK